MIEKRLVLVLGDQLDINSELLIGFDPSTSEVLMIESQHESDYVWSHKAKIAFFFIGNAPLCRRVKASRYSSDLH